ncbi:acyltransferase domain-containing protein, partial [Streptomyces sp. NPDC005904]|uniref:acyltransferase domain-containing protein n=1 Tax=Streptomyces sp. NPDC005904 TaxID=3154570 RepID=UPI003405EA45
VAPLLEDWPDLTIGAVNGPGQCLLTGGDDALAEVGRRLTERGVKVTPLRGAVPYHSPLMADIVEEFRAVLDTVEFRTPTMAVVSNVTGRVARGRQMADPEYWIRHLLEPVQFEAGVRAVDQRGRHVFVELGPSAALTALARTSAGEADHVWLSSTFRDDHDGDMIRRSLAKAYEAGVQVSWAGYHDGASRRRIPLPSYPFDGKRYWLPTPRRKAAEAAWQAEKTPGGEQAASGGLFYEQHWVPQPLPDTRREGRRVLVAGDPARLPRGLAEAAAAEGVALAVATGPTALAEALDGEPPTDVCWLWRTAPDDPTADGMTGAERLRAECEANYRDLLAVLDTLGRKGFGRGQRLWLVGEGAQHLPGDKSTEPAAAATLWGFGRVLLTESPQYRATLVDIEPGTGLSALLDECRAEAPGEYQVALRAGHRHVRRLLPGDTTRTWPGGFALRTPGSGDLSDLTLAPVEDRAPAAGEVQVRVASVALTAADARTALDGEQVDGSGPVLGSLAAGTVVAAGAEAAFTAGDEVYVRHDGALRATLT